MVVKLFVRQKQSEIVRATAASYCMVCISNRSSPRANLLTLNSFRRCIANSRKMAQPTACEGSLIMPKRKVVQEGLPAIRRRRIDPPEGARSVTVDTEPVHIRSDDGKWILKDGNKKGPKVFSEFRYFVKMGSVIRDYDEEREYKYLIGTNGLFYREHWVGEEYKDETGAKTLVWQQMQQEYSDGTGAKKFVWQRPCKVSVNYDHEQKRAALRVELGMKWHNGKYIAAQFYLSTVLGWAYNTRFMGSFGAFVEEDWQGDHLPQLTSEGMEVPEERLPCGSSDRAGCVEERAFFVPSFRPSL